MVKLNLPSETYLEALELLFPKEIQNSPEFGEPPGWVICNKGAFTSGMFGAWPPGTKPGNQRHPHLCNAGPDLVANDAQNYIKGKIPLHYMQFTAYRADETLSLRIRYRFNLIKDEWDLNWCKKRWPNGK